MAIGKQFFTNNGASGWISGERYYFLVNDQPSEHIKFVLFTGTEGARSSPKAEIISVPTPAFERLLASGDIKAFKVQHRFPSWLKDCESLSTDELERRRSSSKKPLSAYLADRLLQIEPLIQEETKIINSLDPCKEINKIINADPSKNITRIRYWFFVYVIFGHNLAALMPRFKNIGKGDLQTQPGTKKLGRKRLSGKFGDGYPVTEEMKELLLDGFAQHAKVGRTESKVYLKTLKSHFGCKFVRQDRTPVIIQPEGKPFPSRDQFRYWVHKTHSSELIRNVRYGSERIKTRELGSTGKFSALLRNLMERVEMDAYYCDELPAPLLKLPDTKGATLRPLCVVRAVCCLSGYVVGIGFCHNKEDMQGYLSALFSMAVSKEKYLSLFGMSEFSEEWVSEGVATDIIADRGPASVKKFLKEFAHRSSRELTPSYSPRSKATVESANPRKTRTQGAAVHKISIHNVVGLAKEEIRKLLEKNKTSRAIDRMTPEMIWKGVDPTPDGIWRYMDSKLRTNAMPLNFDDAVRAFLRETTILVCGGWCTFLGRRYSSRSFQNTGIYNKIGRNKTAKLKGYVLDMCVRYIWIEHEGKIYELEAQLPFLDDQGQLFISLSELQDEAKLISIKASEMRIKSDAEKGIIDSMTEESLGSPTDSYSTTSKLKRTSSKTRRAHKDQDLALNNRKAANDE